VLLVNVLQPQRGTTNSFMAWIHENDLVVLVYAVLVHPVGIEHPEVPAPAPDTLLCYALQAALRLEVVYTLAHRLAVRRT
jgi:NAD dependent epimerase/dehydratase family enzyme